MPNAPITIGNNVEGHISGIELGATWEPLTAARLHGSYTWLHRSIVSKPGSADITGGEGNDAPHLATLQLFTDLRPGLRLNVVTRYLAALPQPRVPGYAEADLTLQWDVRPWAELQFVGQNLLHDQTSRVFGWPAESGRVRAQRLRHADVAPALSALRLTHVTESSSPGHTFSISPC